MKKHNVIVTPIHRPFHGVAVGQHFELAPRLARVLVRMRRIEYVTVAAPAAKAARPPAPPPAPVPPHAPADEYEGMEYAELRDLVRDRSLEPGGRARADYLAALRNPGKYLRRDLTAEE